MLSFLFFYSLFMEHTITKKIAFSTAYQYGGKIVSTALGLFSIALITRYLGVEGYGQYATAMAFVGIFSIVADMGLYIYVVREISRDEAMSDRVVSNVFTFRIFSAGVLLALAPIFALLFPYNSQIWLAILLMTLSYFFISLNQVLIGIFQKRFDTKMVAVAEVIGRCALVGAVVVAIILNFGLQSIVLATVIGSFINFIIVFVSAKKHVKISLAFDFKLWREVLKVTWPIAISVVLNVIYFKIDTVFLSIMKTNRDVGLYSEAYKILEVLIAFPAIFAGLLMPLLSKSAFTDWDKFKRVIRKGFDFLILAGGAVVAVGFALAKPIVVIVGGEQFEPSARILQVLVFAVAAIFIGNLFANAVVAVDKQRKMVWAYLATAVISVIFYWLLIPKYSYMGAAWITVASEVLIMALAVWMVGKVSKAYPSIVSLLKVFGASLAAYMCIILGQKLLIGLDWRLNFIIMFCAGILIYFSLAFLFGLIKRGTMKEILAK